MSFDSFATLPSSIAPRNSNEPNASNSTASSTTSYKAPLPSQFGIYKRGTYDLRISISYCAPGIFTIFSDRDPQSKNHLYLRANSKKPDFSLGTVYFEPKTLTPYITLNTADYPTNPTERFHAHVNNDDSEVRYYFTLYIYSSSSRERFEWRQFSRPRINALEYRTGWILKRIGKNEMVAKFTRASWGWNKKGKMEFMGTGLRLGDGFMVMALLSLLSVAEREKRWKDEEIRKKKEKTR